MKSIKLYYTVNVERLYGRTVKILNSLGIPHTDIYLKKGSELLTKETVKYLLECSEYGFRDILVNTEAVNQILRNEKYTTNDVIDMVIDNPKMLRPLILIGRVRNTTIMLTGVHTDIDNYTVFLPREREMSRYHDRASYCNS